MANGITLKSGVKGTIPFQNSTWFSRLYETKRDRWNEEMWPTKGRPQKKTQRREWRHDSHSLRWANGCRYRRLAPNFVVEEKWGNRDDRVLLKAWARFPPSVVLPNFICELQSAIRENVKIVKGLVGSLRFRVCSWWCSVCDLGIWVCDVGCRDSQVARGRVWRGLWGGVGGSPAKQVSVEAMGMCTHVLMLQLELTFSKNVGNVNVNYLTWTCLPLCLRIILCVWRLLLERVVSL